jgi:hypothetical protein
MITDNMLDGCWGVRDQNKKVYREDDSVFIPTAFEDLVKGDKVKHDLTDLFVYIMMSDIYNKKIDVKRL